MKKLLLKNNLLSSQNKIVLFDYYNYIDACKIIANDIKSKYDVNNGNIELVGLARGALPMLVTISHFIGIRKVSIIQTQMSNSDNCHDYGKFRYISDNMDNEKRNCILLEDIIYKGTTTQGVIDILKNKNKQIVDVYSLIIDEGFKKIKLKEDKLSINYVFEINRDDWVYFFWETDLREIDR